MQYTDTQLLDRVESTAAGFNGWKKGLYLVTVRSKADVPDAFDDKAYLFDCKADGARPVFLLAATCTTNAGTDGLRNFRTKYKLKGCAVLKADQIVYNSHEWGKHKGYNAYRQAKGFPYFRDADGDDKAEEILPELGDVIFANIHRASPNHKSTVNFNWSIACIVLNDPLQFSAFMTLADKRPVSLCILKEF